MTPFILLLALLVFVPTASDAQVLCSPVGPSTICGGYDRNMNNVLTMITPLPGGSSIITGSGPVLAPSIIRGQVPALAMPSNTPVHHPTRHAVPVPSFDTYESPRTIQGLDGSFDRDIEMGLSLINP